MDNSAKEFETVLRNAVITLRDRARHECKSEEVAQRFQEALNFIEVGNSFGSSLLKAVTNKTQQESFQDIFVTPELVRAIRQRDTAAGLAEFKRIAAENENDVVSAISSLNVEMAEQIMPWKLLDQLFKLGANIETSKKVPDRILAFNDKYYDFVANMAAAFPSDDSEALAAKFEKACMVEPAFVYTKYKELAKPHLAAVKTPESAQNVFDDPAVFFAKTPYIGSLPLAEYWDYQVLKNDVNRKYISETFTQLLIGLTGLPMELLGGDMIKSVQNYVEQAVKSKAPPINADGTTNMKDVIGIAMSVIGDMQSNGTLEKMMESMQGATFDIDEEMVSELSNRADLGSEFMEALQAATSASAINDEHPVFASNHGKILEE